MADPKVGKSWLWLLAMVLAYVGVLFATRAALSHPKIQWRVVAMDGHRAGAQPLTLDNVNEALDTYEGTALEPEAEIIRDAQPQLAPLKVVLGHSDAMYMNLRTDPDLPLGNLFVDALRAYGERYFKHPMDFAITNFGGIRVPLPEGPVTMEDVSSMFPFKNYMCYVKMKGSALQALLEQLAGTKAFQPVSGVRVKVKNHKLESALVGGEPIDPDRIYHVTTIDFLLDGGDKINIGALAQEVQLSKVLLKDVMMDYVTGCEARGEIITARADGRVIMEED